MHFTGICSQGGGWEGAYLNSVGDFSFGAIKARQSCDCTQTFWCYSTACPMLGVHVLPLSQQPGHLLGAVCQPGRVALSSICCLKRL